MAGGSLADDGCAQEWAALVGHALLDHLTRLEEQRRWICQPERLCGLQIDHQLELGGLLDGEIAGLGALQDFVDVCGCAPIQTREVCPIGHQITSLRRYPRRADCRYSALDCEACGPALVNVRR